MPRRQWDAVSAEAWVLERYPGATPNEPFPGLTESWRWTCPAGHDARPRLSNMTRLGTNLCKKCSAIASGHNQRTSPEAAAAEVQAQFAGAVPREPYPGLTRSEWRWRCAQGHPCVTTMMRIRAGRHICQHKECKRYAGPRRLTNEEAEARMRARYPRVRFREPFRGTNNPWPMICERGHECSPRPGTVWSGQGLCRRCEALDRGDALRHTHESATRVLQSRAPGAKPLEPYPGKVDLKWRMLCPEGHECAVTLALVTMHFRVSCAVCAHYGFDPSKAAWLYFLPGVRNGFDVWQIGITNNLPQRLRKHARSGFRAPAAGARMLFFEDGREAARMERLVLGRLRDRGVRSLESLWGEQGRFDGYREAFLVCDAPVGSLAEVLRLAGTRRPGSAVWVVEQGPPSRGKRPTSPSGSGR